MASFRVETTAHRAPCRRAPPPWAGPGRLPWPTGGARPGAAPGSWPHTPRPFPAPFPPSSTPGVGDPEARRASGQKPGDAVVDASTAGFSAATRGPPAPFPARGPESALQPNPASRCEAPGIGKVGPGPDAAPSPTVLTRDSALSSFPGLVSRGPQARRLAPRRSARARPRSGPL